MAKRNGTTRAMGSGTTTATRSTSGGSNFSKYDKTDYKGNVIKAIYAEGTERVIGGTSYTDGVVYEDGSASRSYSLKSKKRSEAIGQELANKLGGRLLETHTSGGENFMTIGVDESKLPRGLNVGNRIKPHYELYGKGQKQGLGSHALLEKISSKDRRTAIDIQRFFVSKKYNGGVLIVPQRKTAMGWVRLTSKQ